MTPEQIKFFANAIEKETGILYLENNYYQLEKRLETLLGMLGCKDMNELWEKAQKNFLQIKQPLFDLATNNETSFFRDTRMYQGFEKILLPRVLAESKKQVPLRIWSAACSSGQEPYSIAMILQNLLPTLGPFNYEIFATDFSDRILDRAREGVYSQLEIQRGLPTNLLLKYFVKDDQNYWKANAKIRQSLSFKKFNLLESFIQFGTFDIIFCRNVLIYQNQEKRNDIIKRLIKSLRSKGYLVMGGAENLIGFSDQLEQVLLNGSVFYQLKV